MKHSTQNYTQNKNTTITTKTPTITPKLIIITKTYSKSTIDDVHSVVDSLNKCIA
jgi:hypothetical protein